MRLVVRLIGITFCCAVLLSACKKPETKTEDTVPFPGFTIPHNFPASTYHFDTNPITKDGFELGRKLFYDRILSRDQTISCASCHIQTSAFTQHGHAVSHGVEDRLGVRNSPPLMNLAWSTSLMWDGGIIDLDLQPIAPITSHEEMDDNMENVVEKLQSSSTYPALFEKAFGSKTVTGANMLKALSQFMLMCISAESKYDSVMRQEAVFTMEEQEGYTVFQQKCSNCHAEPLFTDMSFRNNGLTPSMVDDQGRYAITLQENDRYKFKVPSLRNLDYTAPYMHDGRLLNLDAVLEHYRNGVAAMLTLDPALTQNGTTGISLTEEEKQHLIAFLKTLNDPNFLKNPLLAQP